MLCGWSPPPPPRWRLPPNTAAQHTWAIVLAAATNPFVCRQALSQSMQASTQARPYLRVMTIWLQVPDLGQRAGPDQLWLPIKTFAPAHPQHTNKADQRLVALIINIQYYNSDDGAQAATISCAHNRPACDPAVHTSSVHVTCPQADDGPAMSSSCSSSRRQHLTCPKLHDA
jgi:hypothetical protein